MKNSYGSIDSVQELHKGKQKAGFLSLQADVELSVFFPDRIGSQVLPGGDLFYLAGGYVEAGIVFWAFNELAGNKPVGKAGLFVRTKAAGSVAAAFDPVHGIHIASVFELDYILHLELIGIADLVPLQFIRHNRSPFA